MSAEVASDVADSGADHPDVFWAVPNMLRRIESQPPVSTDDPYSSQQWNLWDSVGSKGGHSIKAPQFWRKTNGSPNARVALVDTGVIEHPDLGPEQMVPGYDLVGPDDARSSASTYSNAGDGDGWDANPRDPGDWANKGQCYRRSPARDNACRPYEAAAKVGRKHGSVSIAAAGNEGANADFAVPASCTGFVSVGATSRKASSASYSDVGKVITVGQFSSHSAFSLLRMMSTPTVPVSAGTYVTSSWSASTAPFTYGDSSTVTVRAWEDPEQTVPAGDGPVRIVNGVDREVAVGQLVGGVAVVEIPGESWVGGDNLIRAAYRGSELTAAGSSNRATRRVKKAMAHVTVTTASRIKIGRRPTLRVTVTPVVGPATGAVTVKGMSTTVKRSLPPSGSGKVTITMPKGLWNRHDFTVRHNGNEVVSAVKAAKHYWVPPIR